MSDSYQVLKVNDLKIINQKWFNKNYFY